MKVYAIVHRRRLTDDLGKRCHPYVEVQVTSNSKVEARFRSRIKAEAWISKRVKREYGGGLSAAEKSGIR